MSEICFGIRVCHARKGWYVSWLSDLDHVMLNPDPTAAMRFGGAAAAAALVERSPTLRAKRCSGDAAVVILDRPYRGLRLLGNAQEFRIGASGDPRADPERDLPA